MRTCLCDAGFDGSKGCLIFIKEISNPSYLLKLVKKMLFKE